MTWVIEVLLPFIRFSQLLQNLIPLNEESSHVAEEKKLINKAAKNPKRRLKLESIHHHRPGRLLNEVMVASLS
jgi:hypothetical protein